MKLGDTVIVAAIRDSDGNVKPCDSSKSPIPGLEFETKIVAIYRTVGDDDILVSYKDGWRVHNHNIKEFSSYLEEAIGKEVWAIPSKNILRTLYKEKKSSGEFCIECGEHYPYAEKNHKDGLVCWSCRDSVGWKYDFS